MRCVPARVKICTIPNGICKYFLYQPLKEELKSELEKTDYRVIEPIHLANHHLLGGSSLYDANTIVYGYIYGL